jgi:hypothetical protein
MVCSWECAIRARRKKLTLVLGNINEVMVTSMVGTIKTALGEVWSQKVGFVWCVWQEFGVRPSVLFAAFGRNLVSVAVLLKPV